MMPPWTILILLGSALATSWSYADNLSTADASIVDKGRSIYRTGLTTDEKPIRALVQIDVPLPAAAGACANCHRRSGYGISEGGSRSLTLTASALFNARDKPPLRPAYNKQTLIRAIVAGIAADGRELHATMPRFELAADEQLALVAYLRTLGAETSEGVTDTTLSIATVISDNAPQHEKDAVVQVMRRYVDIKNAESRRESERAAAAKRHFYGRTRQRAHRTWNLVIWNLSGDQSTWDDQLREKYKATRPFAIVSGSTDRVGSLLHKFCERMAVPCILPLSDAPENADDDFYSLYFSSGATLEASVTAHHIAELGLPIDTNVVVVHKKDERSRTAFATLQRELLENSGISAHSKIMSLRKSRSARKWRSLLRSEKPDVLISWLPAESLLVMAGSKLDAALIPERIYTINSYTSWLQAERSAGLVTDRVHHVYPYSLPRVSTTQFPRETLWLRQQGLSDLNQVAAAKVLYACRVLGVGLADIQSNFSREYLLESLEHALDGTQLTSLFPTTSLGPNQRLLSRGAYLVDLSQISNGQFANPVWIQP